jgi:arylsulfatase
VSDTINLHSMHREREKHMQPVTAFAVLGLALTIAGTPVAAQEQLDRTALPIAEPKRPTYRELDARQAKPPARFEVTAPAGAPNVVIVLIDDIGFGGPSTFGGPIRTPTMDQLAQAGLRFNNFHTTALCSPTRNALKTGRNHHTTNTGSIMETATAFPGNTGQVPNSVAPLAEMLRLNGYSPGAFGWYPLIYDGVVAPLHAATPTETLLQDFSSPTWYT